MAESVQVGDRSNARYEHSITLRVRYSDTDQMGTFYNSRPLEWFECCRTELLRDMGMPYSEMETRGLFFPLVEAHVEYLGRARYDDLLQMTSVVMLEGRARLRCDVMAVNSQTQKPVVKGYTIHAFADASGKAMRPPPWFLELLRKKQDRESRDRLETFDRKLLRGI